MSNTCKNVKNWGKSQKRGAGGSAQSNLELDLNENGIENFLGENNSKPSIA